MNRKYFAIFCLLALIIVALKFSSFETEPIPPMSPIPSDPELETEPELSLSEALETITEEECKDYVFKLADDKWEGRMSGKAGNIAAAEWIKQYHEKNGLETEYQKFDIRRLNPGPNNETGNNFTQNIFAWIEGENPNEIVVLGAHMDHIGYGPSMSRSRKIAIHPGADDNASGTAAIMEVAEALSKMGKPKRTIVIQHYSGEEMGLIGSRYYCKNPTFPRESPNIKDHVAMVNLDMVGYLDKGTYFTGWRDGESSIDLRNIIKKLNEKYVFANKITSRGGGGSDHAPFYNNRVPVAFLHTGGHKHYHTPSDTPDKLNYSGLEQVSKYTLELVWELANSESKPVFNVANFKHMDYKHDHGHPEITFEKEQ